MRLDRKITLRQIRSQMRSENLLDPNSSPHQIIPLKQKKKREVRKFSFFSSKFVKQEELTVINGIIIPSLPGTCYHAIICSLAKYANCFVPLEKIYALTKHYMIKYGSEEHWVKFRNKDDHFKQRIYHNITVLDRKFTYGFKLHERGMTIYIFKDGAMLLTGGKLQRSDKGYNVIFPDGRSLQKRKIANLPLYRDYLDFVQKGLMDKSGTILNKKALAQYRRGDLPTVEHYRRVCVTLNENYDQITANRLQRLGLIVTQIFENDVIGFVHEKRIEFVQKDKDVMDIIELLD